MARINKVGHVVLEVRDVEVSAKFFSEALGMELVRFEREWVRPMAFLSFGTQHHDIAMVKARDDAERGDLGLNHVAFQIDGGEAELEALRQKLVDYGVGIERFDDHGWTKGVYFFDPDGNRLEIFCEMLEPEEGRNAMKSGASKEAITQERDRARTAQIV